ncbi:hypothetical protein SIN8267_00333 [Sinobacterium norvegicum]|uniref:Tat pathway signal protein n=1 Tax=Sinobacterium norvegicum TaxID=1641715 RepID=A0ABN8EDB0_9GAMM|nr:DUF1501 domain-containing protein [Sinobacterium norvegicum]CAH0990241.1 hypothetical protein SIN8267_00333 [Sinobacterium norvegicum]
MSSINKSRREFLKATAVSSVALSSLGLQLNIANVNAAGVSDYKALVCIFLAGGNDGFNMFMPTSEAEYNTYSSSRQTMAIPLANILPVNNVEYGFHPGMPEVQSLFNNNNLVIVANTGALIEPTTLDDINSKTVVTPIQLFSHRDQEQFWHSLDPTGQYQTGWAGRLEEKNYAAVDDSLPINFSLSGNNLWQSGSNSVPYTMSSAGAITLDDIDAESSDPTIQQRSAVFNSLLSKEYTDPLMQHYADTQKISNVLSEKVDTALALNNNININWPDNKVSAALKTVAQLIEAKTSLAEQNRQIFYITFGGWDTHGNQLESHQQLLTELSQSLQAFYDATTAMGLQDSVTTFTASEFGRTLTTNGDGTDHGWGNHHLVMGGAVDGGKIVGKMPDLTIGGDDDYSDGRIIPTTSIDSYGATLTSWLGVNADALNKIFPNLKNFPANEKDLKIFV